mgnify:FL=1|tara:strand:+ start:887 stop:1390 length:504 start_codon:yes stop_codon:yes gene_type:complete
MAVVIQLKRGTSAPSAGSFAVGEPAWDATNGRLYVKNTAGSMVEINPAANAVTDAAQSFTKAQRGSIVTLTDGATVTPDFSLGNNFTLTLGGNRTLANPTNLTAGQSGIILVLQDGTGSRTLSFGSYWKFPGGSAPTLTTSGSAVDLLAYFVESSTRVSAILSANMS